MRIAGTACVVPSATVVARENHVELAASRAKAGKRLASFRPPPWWSEFSGSSSNAIRTTGARGRSPAACALATESRETSELKRKSPRKSSGAGASAVRTSRAPPERC